MSDKQDKLGPWKVADTLGEWDDYLVESDSSDMTVAARIHTKEEANLIAAAPGMLKALKAASQFIENGIEMGYIRLPEDSRDAAHGTQNTIYKAIAKAKGEA